MGGGNKGESCVRGKTTAAHHKEAFRAKESSNLVLLVSLSPIQLSKLVQHGNSKGVGTGLSFSFLT